MRTRPWSWIIVAALLLLVGCDHATKLGAERELRGAPPTPVTSGVDLAYHQNHGIAFNLERVLPAPGRTAVIVLGGVLALGLLGRALWRRRGQVTLEVAGYLLVLGGALGNLIDRLARGLRGRLHPRASLARVERGRRVGGARGGGAAAGRPARDGAAGTGRVTRRHRRRGLSRPIFV